MTKARSIGSSAASASAIFVAAAAVALACAWVDEDSLSYSFFAPETHRSDADRPFFRSFRTLYTEMTKDDNCADFYGTNIEEWSAYLGDGVTERDLAFLLGPARTGQIDTLLFRQRDPAYPAADSLASNGILRASDTRAARDALFYFGYAKRCEPYVTFVPGWIWQTGTDKPDPRRDTAAIAALIAGGLKNITNARDQFVRARYLFQVLRLRFHAKQYEACARMYRERAADFEAGRSIAWRAMAYAAGALHRQKKFEEANVLFARAQEGWPSLRVSSYLSYHPLQGAAWKRCLALAATPRERAVLWQLQGVYGDPLEAMEAIAAMDPSSNLLDLLLVRAVNIAEESFMPDPFGYESGDVREDYSFRTKKLDPALLMFIERIAADPRAHTPHLWTLAAAYLRVIAGRHAEAAPYLDRARAGARGNLIIQQQARVIGIVSRIEQAARPAAAFEEAIVSDLRWLAGESGEPGLRGRRAYDWALKRLSARYAAQGNVVKAQCLFPASEPAFHRDPVKRREMLEYMDKPEKSAFDVFALAQYPYSKKDIIEVQAVELLYRHRLDEAAAVFAAYPASGADTLYGDPFVMHVNDCHDCDHAAAQEKKYTKLSFVQRLIELRGAIERDPDRSATLLFELANGLYNMTYFGNARRLYETTIFPYGLQDLASSHDPWIAPIMDCSKAEAAYRAAMKRTMDRELQARCVFMAAKCERNTFYLNRPPDFKGDFRAGAWFRSLRDSYADTRYFREIVRECGYFRTFVAGK